MANGRCGKPPMTPFVAAEISQKPWMPNEQVHAKALEGWEILQKTHKRPSPLDIGFQAFIAYNVRFVLSGDLARAWKTFGGLAAQLTHLGTVVNIAITENATTSQTDDREIRQHASELYKFREREKTSPNSYPMKIKEPNEIPSGNAVDRQPSHQETTGAQKERARTRRGALKERAKATTKTLKERENATTTGGIRNLRGATGGETSTGRPRTSGSRDIGTRHRRRQWQKRLPNKRQAPR